MPYVIGNSRQVLQFSDSFRAFLDARPDVFVVNHFPTHWRLAGFRPGVWVWGDTYQPDQIEACKTVLRSMLVPELANVRAFVSITSTRTQIPPELAGTLGVTFYRRNDWRHEDQVPARTLREPLFHLGSVLTNAVNLAGILFPGEPIFLFGCPFKGPAGHFYDPTSQTDAVGCEAQWKGFEILRQFGLLLVNCNTEGEAFPGLPCGHGFTK